MVKWFFGENVHDILCENGKIDIQEMHLKVCLKKNAILFWLLCIDA